MRPLGGEIATEDKKRKPFSKRFISLGARVDWSRILDNKVILENEPGRTIVVSDLAKQILSQDPIRSPLLLSMRGKVLIDDSQLFDNLSAVACNPIARVVRDGGSRVCGALLKTKLECLRNALASAASRNLERRSAVRPILFKPHLDLH